MNGYARQPVQPVGGIFQPTAEFRRDMGRDILRLAQGVNGGSLRDGGGAVHHVIVEPRGGPDDIRRRHQVAHPHTGHHEIFGEGIDAHRPLPHSWDRNHRRELSAAEDEAGINIVANGQQVMADTDLGDLFQILFGIDCAGGVVGSVEQQRLCFGRNQAFQPLRVQRKALLPISGQRHRGASRQPDLVWVNHKIGVGHNHLVPRVHNRHHGFRHADTTRRGDHHLV